MNPVRRLFVCCLKKLLPIWILTRSSKAQPKPENDFTLQLAKGTVEHLDEIDALIESKLKNWKLSRISKVSLSILRMAVYELKYLADVPASVAINEAVELAKQYASEDDYSFVNGVLGNVAKELDAENQTGKE